MQHACHLLFIDHCRHNIWEYACINLAKGRTPFDMCCCSGSSSSTEAFVTKLHIAFLAQTSLASAWFADASLASASVLLMPQSRFSQGLQRGASRLRAPRGVWAPRSSGASVTWPTLAATRLRGQAGSSIRCCLGTTQGHGWQSHAGPIRILSCHPTQAHAHRRTNSR